MNPRVDPFDALGNTPRAFFNYIQSITFDRKSLHSWEIETLSLYLGLPKYSSSHQADTSEGNAPLSNARVIRNKQLD